MDDDMVKCGAKNSHQELGGTAAMGAAETNSNFLLNITDKIAEPLFVKDAHYRFVFVNEAFCRFVGYSAKELLGKHDECFFPKKQAELFVERDKEAFSSAGPVLRDDVISGPRGIRIISTFRSVYSDAQGGRYVIGVFRDVTDSKRSQDQLACARDSAERVIQEKSEFVANMSHELRTPIHGVLGMTTLLDDTELTDEQKEYVNVLKECSQHLCGLVDDVLAFSRIERGKLELVKADFYFLEQLEKLNADLALQAREHGLSYLVNLEESLPKLLYGDSDKLKRVIISLVSNAIKFTASGGKVELQVQRVWTKSGQVCLRFRVSDTGIGVPQSKRDAIFEAFRQADGSTTRRHGGVGLGLAIASQLVKLFDGELGIGQKDGWTTSFHFTACFGLSLLDSIEGVPSVSQRAKKQEGARKLRILLVEDNVINQKVAAKFIEEEGHLVVVAENGELALQLMEQDSFDLVFLDIQMPVLDGFETIKEIRSREKGTGRRIPVVAVTAYAAKSDRDKCLELGMDDYLPKPFVREQLSLAIARHCLSVARRS